VEHLAVRWRAGPFTRATRARETRASISGRAARLLKPQTYMNRSGAAVATLTAEPGFDPSKDLLVLVDDVALPLGRFRLRGAGSSGGHNGLKSIEAALRRQDYARLRIGVGPAPAGLEDLADFVLDEFTSNERETLAGLLEPMSDAVECWAAEGIEAAMSRHNR
jgi:PTH1 family peptidyl-tRNA hydrolase